MTKRVTIRAESWRKNRWEEAVEHIDEYDSVTQLIKLAVGEELEGFDMATIDGGGRSTAPPSEATNADGGGGYNPDVENAEILQRLKGIDKTVEEIKAVTKETKTRVEDSNTENLQSAITEVLPESEANAIGPKEVADRTEYPTPEALSVLADLGIRTTYIKQKTVEKGGIEHELYWKEV